MYRSSIFAHSLNCDLHCSTETPSSTQTRLVANQFCSWTPRFTPKVYPLYASWLYLCWCILDSFSIEFLYRNLDIASSVGVSNVTIRGIGKGKLDLWKHQTYSGIPRVYPLYAWLYICYFILAQFSDSCCISTFRLQSEYFILLLENKQPCANRI